MCRLGRIPPRARILSLISLSILLSGIFPTSSPAQTWRVTTVATAIDRQGQFCGICPEQSDTMEVSHSFTLPPDAPTPLTTLVNMPSVNYQDAGNYICFGPPAQAWCKDWSKVRGESNLGTSVWTAKHALTAHSFPETDGYGDVESSATGVMKIGWPGHANGTPVPVGFKAKFRATGALSAVCGDFSTSTADMSVTITITALARANLTFPPDFGPLQGSWTVTCPAPANAGPFEVIEEIPAGLQVGDRYAYSITLTNSVAATSFGLISAEAEATADFPNTASFLGESAEIPPVAFDLGVPEGTLGVGDGNGTPVMMLLQNYPNPFSFTTVVRYTVPRAAKDAGAVPVRLSVFSISGRRVATLVDGLREPGDYAVTLDGAALARSGPGVYFYRLNVGGATQTRKLVFN